MKSLTLAMLLAAAGPLATMASAQDPTPPARPVPAPAPAPAVRPAPAPRPAAAPRAIQDPFDVRGFAEIDRESVRQMSEMARELARQQSRLDVDVARELARGDAEYAREIARANAGLARSSVDIDREMVRANAEIARANVDLSRMDLNLDLGRQLAPLAAMAPMAPLPPMDLRSLGSMGDGFVLNGPPAAWAQGDPADSLYRVARDVFNRGEYGRAAKMFDDIRSKFPKSAYANESQYYEAYSRYRIGTTDELHTAAKLLEPMAAKVTGGSESGSTNGVSYAKGFGGEPAIYRVRNASDGDVSTLYTRVLGALAQRGDKDAADKVSQLAAKRGSSFCDNEDVQVKVEAMNALSQMDPNAALPIFRRALDRKDECSAELRRRAVFMLGRRGDAESAQLLIATAKSDPSPSVRAEAINTLPRLQGDVGINALEDMLRTEQNEAVQSYVVHALMSSDNPKTRSSMRALIDRKDAPLKLRIEAINSMNSSGATTDDASYLRNLYGRADNDRMKDAIIGAVGRMGGSENDKWILSIAQNQNEPSQLRSTAISRLIRSNVSIADLGKLYDSSDNLNVRQQLVSVLGSRKEPEATDKLIDIFRNSTVTSIKLQAINALQRKNDPRTVELLNNIIEGKKP